jgi:hypothetical protein
MRAMSLFEVITVIAVGALALAFASWRTKTNFIPKNTGDRWHVWATIASPFVVAVVVTLGLAVLGADNLAGGVIIHEFPIDHATAIQNLFFGH